MCHRHSVQLGCRARSKKDIAFGFFKSVGKSLDGSFDNHKDSDPYFEEQKFFIVHFNVAFVEYAWVRY